MATGPPPRPPRGPAPRRGEAAACRRRRPGWPPPPAPPNAPRPPRVCWRSAPPMEPAGTGAAHRPDLPGGGMVSGTPPGNALSYVDNNLDSSVRRAQTAVVPDWYANLRTHTVHRRIPAGLGNLDQQETCVAGTLPTLYGARTSGEPGSPGVDRYNCNEGCPGGNGWRVAL